MLIVVIVLVGLGIFAGQVSRGVQKAKQHHRCAYCRAKLKKAAGRMEYATTCSKCGRDQPWAKA